MSKSYELIPAKAKDGGVWTVDECKAIERDRSVAMIFIRGADTTRYGTLVAELSNDYAAGKEDNPTDITAYSRFVNYTTQVNDRPKSGATGNQYAMMTTSTSPEVSAMTFAQREGTPGTNGLVHEGFTCYNCQGTGHYTLDCPAVEDGNNSIRAANGATLLQHAYMLAQSSATEIDPGGIYSTPSRRSPLLKPP